ncbi:MAG: RNA polymerase sigma factor [Actinomycetes bacterium]
MRQAPSSFDAAYPALYRRAYSAAYRLLGNRPEAEDVAQEALTRGLVRWRGIEPYAEAWVVRIATNLAIDVVRRRLRRHEETKDAVSIDRFVDERVDLVRALSALPRRQREVVALRFLGDFSEADVAKALGLSNGTVKSHAARGLAAMRAHLQPVPEGVVRVQASG